MLKPTLVKDIQVFIGFANFYQYFIQDFSKIAALFTLLLKAIESSNLALKILKVNNNKIVGVSDRTNGMVINLFKNKKSRNLMYILNIGAIKKPNFLIFDAKKVFNYLQLAFVKVLIFQHFDLKSHI